MTDDATERGRAGDVLVRADGALRRLTLNRPAALNALNLAMVETMSAYLRAWATDASVAAVLIDGAGERALCAGGDLRALYDAAKAKDLALPARFWASEYRLDLMIARYRKPVVVVMDGLVMGGGVGLSAHAAQRIVTERSAVAMPETGIGYFPDVGASFLLARAPGLTGLHLALTGARIGAADAIYCGLADRHVGTAALANLPARLAGCRSAASVAEQIDALASSPAPGTLPAARSWIDQCYAAATVEEILARLSTSTDARARAAAATLARASPTALKITLRNVRAALSFQNLEESFAQDYCLSLACIAGHDFVEGIRAAIVDKDRNPAWRPRSLEEVTAELVARHFAAPRPDLALRLHA